MRQSMKLVALIGAGAAMSLLGGCAYDYLQHTDRVGYSAGDAVKANMAKQTTNPSKDSMYNTGGLGKDGALATEPEVVFEDIEGDEEAAAE